MNTLADTGSLLDWTGRRVVAIADFDSFLRASKYFGDVFAEHGASVEYRIAQCRDGQLSAEQLAACGLTDRDVDCARLAGLALDPTVLSADVIILALNGARTRTFITEFHRQLSPLAKRRPLLVSLYPGILFRFHLEGMMSRSSADLLLLNSRHDLELYRAALQESALDPSNAMAVGLPMLPSRSDAEAHEVASEGDVLFVGQPTVPAGRYERMYTAERLVELARRHPNRRVVLRPRHRPTETTMHRMRFHYEDMLRALDREIPSNLVVEYGPMQSALERASLVLTYSSTAAIEAAVRGIPTRILTDLGVHENLGNQFYLGSGMLARFDEIDVGAPWRLAESWAERHVLSARDHAVPVLSRLAADLQVQARDGRPLPCPNHALFSRSEAYERFVVERFGAAALAEFGQHGGTLRLSATHAAKRRIRKLRNRVVALWPGRGSI